MKNSSNTETYSLYDHVFARAVRSVSRIVSVRKLTQPFWNRWRGGKIEERALFDFLGSIRSFDDWPAAAVRMIEQEASLLESERHLLTPQAEVERLRRLSYLCNLGQWGTMPINHQKIQTYNCCRDFYIEAETIAFGNRYRRISAECAGKTFYANVHVPEAKDQAAPVIVILHGIDGCKEENLATELALVSRGFVVVGLDGPGQAEALFLDGILWDFHFPGVLSALLDKMDRLGIGDTQNVGLLGISLGAVWAYQSAVEDCRIQAIYDVGSPINSKGFSRIPFLLKTKICQAFGANSEAEILAQLEKNEIDDPGLLSRINAAVRIVHGTRDRFVPHSDKIWLKETIERCTNCEVSFLTFDDGHCCTNHAQEVQRDFLQFFLRSLKDEQI